MRCPLCAGTRFASFSGRPNERCRGCGSLSRHRFQALVLQHALLVRGTQFRKAVHVAPNPSLSALVRSLTKRYITLDVDRDKAVDVHASLTRLPFEKGEVDLIVASHVLEHIAAVDVAIREIHRVLCPGGVAVLEVPTFVSRTQKIDPRSNAHGHHWRPGRDWTAKYAAFADVREFDPQRGDFRGLAVAGGSPVHLLRA